MAATSQQAKLEAIRKWSLTQDDGTRDSGEREMEESRRAWLAEALAEMQNHSKVVQECAAVLQEPDPSDEVELEAVVHRKAEALDRLIDRVEDLDNAKDLHRVGGLVPVLAALRTPHAVLRWRACDALGTTVQNNPDAQAWAFEHKAAELLLFLGQNETEEKPFTKCLYAISSLTRGHGPSLAFFLENGLVAILQRALTEATPRDANRALFMARNICLDSPDRGVQLLAPTLMPTVLPLATAIGTEDESLRETSLGLLETMCTGEGPGPDMGRQAAKDAGAANALQALQQHLDELQGAEEIQDAEEQRRLCASLVAALAG